MLRWIIALLLSAGVARAEGEPAGAFDYYVLALSWSPGWCAAEGDARRAEVCEPGAARGFVLHGLWPQYETGWPSYCRTGARDPSRRQTAAMVDIMGSDGLAWHQWKKHGRCSGLSAAAYFEHARAAFAAIERPDVLRAIPRPLAVAPAVVEAAILEANPDLVADGVTVTCRDGRLREVRICLTRDLAPRVCGADVRRDCGADTVEVLPLR
ncbi:MAG: ribonuclease T2 [Pseudomonadota bacterium]